MRPAPFFVSGPVPVHCTGAGRSSGSGTVRLLRFGFRARFRASLRPSRRSRLSRASGPPVPRPSPLPGAAPVPRPSFRGRPGTSVPVPERAALPFFCPAAPLRAATSCAVALSAHSALPSLCDNMAGAFLSACLSSFPDIVSNLRGISYFLPAFVVSMCLWIYSVSRSGVSRSVLRCISAHCLLLFSCFRPSAHCPAAFCAAGAAVFPSSRFCLYRLP